MPQTYASLPPFPSLLHPFIPSLHSFPLLQPFTPSFLHSFPSLLPFFTPSFHTFPSLRPFTPFSSFLSFTPSHHSTHSILHLFPSLLPFLIFLPLPFISLPSLILFFNSLFPYFHFLLSFPSPHLFILFFFLFFFFFFLFSYVVLYVLFSFPVLMFSSFREFDFFHSYCCCCPFFFLLLLFLFMFLLLFLFVFLFLFIFIVFIVYLYHSCRFSCKLKILIIYSTTHYTQTYFHS